MNCYSCKCKCVPLFEYDGMYPSDVRCPQCGRVFDGDGDLIETTNQEKEWQDAWLRVCIRMAVRCKQRIDNIPIALIPSGSASECWNGHRGDEE